MAKLMKAKPARRPAIPVPRLDATRDRLSLDHAVRLIHWVCYLAGSPTFINDVRREIGGVPMRAAIRNHDTPAIFDWLVSVFSFQGISDYVAEAYMAQHGTVTWRDLDRTTAGALPCPKLTSYWQFYDCRYHKGTATCSEPNHVATCPLPRHDLRNGRLNQTAYSLYLFVRDIAGGDVVTWIDRRLSGEGRLRAPDRLRRMHHAVIGPLRQVYGVSDKVLAMTLSSLFLGGPRSQRNWLDVGASMVAVDTLVHNFLHRTGIMHRFGAEHSYGPQCYEPGRCASVVDRVANEIDARQFNPRFPRTFPRFVQHAIWRYCAQQGLDVCNGNQINDRRPCKNTSCTLYSICDRIRIV
jgi:hypothetical protein